MTTCGGAGALRAWGSWFPRFQKRDLGYPAIKPRWGTDLSFWGRSDGWLDLCVGHQPPDSYNV
jgi:hypothetical protein